MKYTIKEAAIILGYKEAYIRNLIFKKQVKTIKEGKFIYLEDTTLLDFAKKKGLDIEGKLEDLNKNKHTLQGDKRYTFGYKITGEGVKALAAIENVLRHEFLYKEEDKRLIQKFFSNLDNYKALFEDEKGKPLEELIAATRTLK